MANLIIITLNWLNVDRAIIFFISHSVMADSPDIMAVREAVINKNDFAG